MTRPPDLKELDTQVEQFNLEKERAVAEQDFEKAAHLRDQADKLKKRKENITREWREKGQGRDRGVGEGGVGGGGSKKNGPAPHRLGGNQAPRPPPMGGGLHKPAVRPPEGQPAL